ncbi:MAG: FtsX-like permease family protein [Ekhidna sp.]
MSHEFHPPKLAQRILKWYAGRADMEDIEGDLDEVYQLNVSSDGRFKAAWQYWIQIFSLLFSYGLKKRKKNASYSTHYYKNSMTMFKNYFQIAYRNLKKQKTFTLINVAGLAMGMSIALLALAMFVELNQFDEFHPNAENTYRITTKLTESGDVNRYASSPPALTYAIDEQIDGIRASVHINDHFFPIIEHKGNEVDSWGYFTEPSFFDVFAFTLEEGTSNALNQPNQIIITKELATKLYGADSPLNKIIETKKYGQLIIAGVLTDFPKRTHLKFDFLIGFSSADKFNANMRSAEWTEFRSNYYYFNIAPDQKKKIASQIEVIGKSGDPVFQSEEKKANYQLQRLTDITPGDMMSDTIGIEFDRPTMILFFGVSLLILIPACFNYTNMSIAVALKRAKEVGVRKVLGSHRKQIMGQFLVETIIICMMAVGLSTFIFNFIRQEFLSMLTGSAALSLDLSEWMILTFILFAIATGIVTGIGPAIYFAKISPIQALRSDSSNQKVNISGVRKGLLVFQFTLTLGFMIGIGVLLKEYQEARGYEYSFNVENTFIIPTQGQDVQLIRNTYTRQPGVENLSFSSSIPGTPLTNNLYLLFPELQDSMRVRQIYVDEQFTDHMNLEYIWGDQLSNETYQIEKVVANQSLMERMKLLNPDADSTNIVLSDGRKAQIVGVIKDYNHEPLNHRIEPMLIRVDQEFNNYAIVTMNAPANAGSYSKLENAWEELFPNQIFQASLLKNELDSAYTFFQIGMKIFGFLAALAISISCLGLLGMVIFATESRTKEVAIRKILGANKKSLFATLAGLFMKLWGIALLFAIPISYAFYDLVLIRMYNKFSDGVGFIEIALSVFITLSLGAIAIFWQVNKVAKINPAINLRNE